MVHPPIFLLRCLVPSLLGFKLMELFLPNTTPFYMWELVAYMSSDPTLLLWFSIWILGLLILLSLVCLSGGNG